MRSNSPISSIGFGGIDFDAVFFLYMKYATINAIIMIRDIIKIINRTEIPFEAISSGFRFGNGGDSEFSTTPVTLRAIVSDNILPLSPSAVTYSTIKGPTLSESGVNTYTRKP